MWQTRCAHAAITIHCQLPVVAVVGVVVVVAVVVV
jgi:hypothetical protein